MSECTKDPGRFYQVVLDADSSPQTHAIIGACIEVHRRLGRGFLETAYQEALAIEFQHQGVPFNREVALPIEYRGQVLPTVYRADFVCFGNIIVELKAIAGLSRIEEAQVLNYLVASGRSLALLCNFGSNEVQIRRMVNRFHDQATNSPTVSAGSTSSAVQ